MIVSLPPFPPRTQRSVMAVLVVLMLPVLLFAPMPAWCQSAQAVPAQKPPPVPPLPPAPAPATVPGIAPSPEPAKASATGSPSSGKGAVTGLSVPRFATLRAERVNVRLGPGLSYPIAWIYQRAGLPVEVVAEYDTWRKIRDIGQTEGWVHQSMLSGQRGVMVLAAEGRLPARIQAAAGGADQAAVATDGAQEQPQVLRRYPEPEAGVVARLEPGVVAVLKSCRAGWCEIDADGHSGWMPAALLYGAGDGALLP